jgi:competence protein ComEC
LKDVLKKDPERINGREIVFVRILFPYIAGILLAYPFASIQLLKWCAATSLIMLAFHTLINIFYVKLKVYRHKAAVGSLFFIFWFTAGLFCCLFHLEAINANHFSKTKYDCLKIRIAEEPQLKNNIISFKAEAQKAYFKEKGHQLNRDICGKLLIALSAQKSGTLNLTYGEEFVIRAKVKIIEPPSNPGEFDYKCWLSMQQINHHAFLKNKDIIAVHHNSGNPLNSFAIKFRAEQVAFYQRVLSSKDNFALASTLILGYKSDLSKETLAIYSKTGTIHALSVSGMHVGLVYFVLNWALQFMDRKKVLKVIKVSLLLISVWFYALITGFSPSVLRSVVMITVFIIASSFVRKPNNYNIIAFAAFCLLLYNPFLLWDIGFQLSFLAILGLIMFQPKIENCWIIENRYMGKLWSAIAASLSAQLATFPLTIYYFHQFPVYFLLSNIFIMIPAALIMYSGIVLLLFRLSSLAPVFEWLINFTNKGLEFISQMPYANISGIWINKAELLLLSGSLALSIMALYFRQKHLLLVSFILLLVFQSLLTFDHLTYIKQRKTICFRIRKTIISARLNGETATLISREKPLEKDFNYFIKPGLEQFGIRYIYWKTVSAGQSAVNR